MGNNKLDVRTVKIWKLPLLAGGSILTVMLSKEKSYPASFSALPTTHY
jgi:hypothetical protein